MEGTNTFENGLHRSNSPQMQPEGSYVDALNWIRNDSGRLINEELEEITQNFTHGTYELLGSCPIQDSFICFFKFIDGGNNPYSEIGIFDNNTKQYTRVFNDFFHPSYKLNFNNKIDSVARIVGTVSNPSTSPSGDRIVYFVEKDAPPRRFNIDLFLSERQESVPFIPPFVYTYNSLSYNSSEDFNLFLTLKLPSITTTIQDTGGSLRSGVYAVIFRYRTANNDKTIFNIPSRFYSITDDSGVTWDSDGAPPDTPTGKSITFTIDSTDDNYFYIEPVIITYKGIENNLIIKSLGTYENKVGKQIIFSSETQYGEDVTLTEINQTLTSVASAQCIEQKDNVLVLSNIKNNSYDSNFQEVANNIEVYCGYEKVTFVNNVRLTTSPGENGALQNHSRYIYYSESFIPSEVAVYAHNEWAPDVQAYLPPDSVYKNPLREKGFQRGEVYSLSITPIYKDGSLGFAYHIPPISINNRKAFFDSTINENIYTTDEYSSNEDYPSYILNDFPNLGSKIKHHRIHDFSPAPDGVKAKPLITPMNTVGGNSAEDYRTGDARVCELNILKLKFKNINFTDAQKNSIQGYIIGFQQRNTVENKSIIDTGWGRPFLKTEGYSRNSILNGSFSYKFNDGKKGYPALQGHMGGLIKTFSYHSPYVNRLGEGFPANCRAQIYGYLEDINYRPKIAYYAAKQAQKPLYILFDPLYFHPIRSSPKNITGVSVLGDIGDEYIIDNQLDLRYAYSSGFTYIKLDPTGPGLFDDADWLNYIGTGNAFNKPDEVQELKVRFAIDSNKPGNDYNNDDYFIVRQCKREQGEGYNFALVRITINNTSQYGRLEEASYIPSKVVLNTNLDTNTSPVAVEGDVYITRDWDYRRDTLWDRTDNSNTDQYWNTFFWVGIWYESVNNYSYRHQGANEQPYFPKNRKLVGPGSINNTGNWYGRGFGYNRQYSALSNFRVTIPRPQFFNEVVNFPNRSIYSVRSFENELVDQYRIFPSLQFHDIPKDRGIITDTFVFNNNFFHHTEYGLWLSFFNPNTTQTTSQGQVVLGNAGIFQLPSKLILDIKGGYMGTMDKSGTNTPFGRVFLDHKQGKVFLFAGDAPEEISDLGLFSFFRGFVNTNDEYSMGYDWANKRLLLNNITQGKVISFYPKTKTWTSFHDFSPKAYFTTNGYSYAWKDNSFYNLNNQNDERKNSYITFVENTAPDSFKRFDRIEMNTLSGGANTTGSPGFVEPNDYVFLDKSFTHLHAWTDRQNTTELPFAYGHDFNTNFLLSYKVDEIPVNYYRSSFHSELPLDAVIDPYQNIFNPNNTDINAEFRAHMKGKFLYTKLSYKDMFDSFGNLIKANKPLVLNYIKTFFKPSVA